MDADNIKKLLDIMGVNAGTPYTERVQISCPFAPWSHKSGTDKSPSLSIKATAERSLWLCFGCGRSGTLPGLAYQWAEATRQDPLPWLDFIEKMEGSLDAVMSQVETKLERKWNPPPAEVLEVWSEEELKPYVGKVPQYILDRGISLAQCKEWELGYDKKGPRYNADGRATYDASRVIFPVRREDGKLVGITGRRVNDEDEPKYFHYWNYLKSKYLYGLNKVKDPSYVVVVEGFIDVIRWAGYGIPVVGTFGTKLSSAQTQLLAGFSKVYLALDNDPAGIKGTETFLRRLNQRVHLFKCTLLPGKRDPKDHTFEEAWDVIDKAELIL